MYVALDCVPNIKVLFLVDELTESSTRVKEKVESEYQRVHQENFFRLPKELSSSPDYIKFCLLKVPSLSKHAVDIMSDKILHSINVLRLSEAQLISDQIAGHTQNALSIFNSAINSIDDHRFDNLDICSKETVTLKHMQI